MCALEPRLEGLESELRDVNLKYEQMLVERNTMKEHLEVLTQDPSFFRGEGNDTIAVSAYSQEGEQIGTRVGGLRYLTGVINSDHVALFERLIYRSTRGNMFLRTHAARELFEDPETGEMVEKTVFVVFFSAQRVHDKIRKLCESMHAKLYPHMLDNVQERQRADEVRSHLGDLKMTIASTEELRADIIRRIRQNIYHWRRTVVVEKSVFHTLNLLTFKGQTVLGQCWAPASDYDRICTALQEAERISGARHSFAEVIHTQETPPTYFRTNKFTATHQGIVESYGIARYKEVNPTCFSIITFPFLFGVMYGDIGHGIMLTILAGLFILYEKKLLATNLNEIIAIVFGGRYVLFMMGLFAIYLGFLYNDFFGMMIAPFGSPFWYFPISQQDATDACDKGYVVWYGAASSLKRACKMNGGTPYPFGVDAEWAEAENKLEFMNALKMKMAVILGVGQMMWGLVLQLLNHLYFGDMHHVWFGFIPEVIFLSCTFGYMCLMILIKWTIDWSARMSDKLSPPSLLEAMTNFFLAPGAVQEDKFLFGSAGFQNFVQYCFLLCAVLCVPLLLFPIPFLEWRHSRQTNYMQLHHIESGSHGEPNGVELQSTHTDDALETSSLGHPAHPPSASDMSEIIIKQVIHTIEYVLGCVSNTASYLRLWALSLAHAQLSEVFWNFAWMRPLTMDGGSGIMVFIGWGIWAGATVAVLGVMESLSAFLHALRLHWVEFQNKFYYGDGVQFVPYDVNALAPLPLD